MAEMKRDMEILARNRFNLIKIQQSWAIDEPVEGQIDLSFYEELIDHARKLQMGVYFGLTCEHAPAWLWRKHPDCRMVGRNGVPIYYEARWTLPADGKPGPCFDHPGAAAEQARFITQLVKTLGRFENIVVWNTWQEVGYWAEADFLSGQQVCFCEHTLSSFRCWLKSVHGDIDALNRAWRARYSEFLDILPTRTIRGKDTSPQDIAWNYFLSNVKIAKTLRERFETIRAADHLERPMFAQKATSAFGSTQDWTMARCQDFLGSSCYPGWSIAGKWDDDYVPPGNSYERETALRAELWNIALQFDYVRSFNKPEKPVWAAEFQGGPISAGLHKSRVPAPDDIRRWMLASVAAGVSGICFWVARAEIAAAEANGFSLLDSEGEETDRLREAARIGAALNRHGDLFGAGASLNGDVAILIDENNFNFCASMIQGGEHQPYAVKAWHRLLWDAGFSVDFVPLTNTVDIALKQYRAAILPTPFSMRDSDIAAIERWIQNGGTLISDASPARFDTEGFCHRGEMAPAAQSLFGVRQKGFTMVREPRGESRWSPTERSWGEYLDPSMLQGVGRAQGCSLRANVYVQTYVCESAEPLWMLDSNIAGTINSIGSGRAILVGTMVGHNGLAFRDADSKKSVLEMIELAGVKRVNSGELLARRRTAGLQEAWFICNPYDRAITQILQTPRGSVVRDLLNGPLELLPDGVRITVMGLDIRVLVLELPKTEMARREC